MLTFLISSIITVLNAELPQRLSLCFTIAIHTSIPMFRLSLTLLTRSTIPSVIPVFPELNADK